AWRPCGPPAPIASPREGKGESCAARFATKHNDSWTRETHRSRNILRHGVRRGADKGAREGLSGGSP
ncbi:MAG: hypothetical protein J7M26_04255, partial [Armatimonadetes bacterium]|nr:hypothetical protein [Armatimonadota bacterium]